MVERVKLPAKSRRPREHKPRFILIHTTQGNASIEVQYTATINWFAAGGTNSSTSWGSSADMVIGHLGQEAWFTDQQDRDYRQTRSNWSAGFGAGGTYGADEYGIAIEVAQTAKGERPPQAALNALVQRCIALCREYDIEPVRILHLKQLTSEPVPSGLVGHEDTENGRKTGKWDPNKQTFPWDWLIEQIRAGLSLNPPPQEEPMSNAYIVQTGDTLGAIAKRFNTTVAELVRINGIANPNVIPAGMLLLLEEVATPPNVVDRALMIQWFGDDDGRWAQGQAIANAGRAGSQGALKALKGSEQEGQGSE